MHSTSKLQFAVSALASVKFSREPEIAAEENGLSRIIRLAAEKFFKPADNMKQFDLGYPRGTRDYEYAK